MARPPRGYWKGALRMSLVSIRVEVFTGVDSSSEISFRQIHKPSGRRVNYEKMVPGVGKIETADIVKGYDIDKDTYVLLEPEEINAIRLDSSRIIDMREFVSLKEIDPRYFERPYILLPEDEHSKEGYATIVKALTETGKAGLCQVTMSGREWLAAVAPVGHGLVLELLRYKDELRPAENYFQDATMDVPEDLVDLAKELIARKSVRFDPSKSKDRYVVALRELVEMKRKGHAILAPKETALPPATNVIDLMEVLRRSVEQEEPPKAPAKSAKAAADAPKPRRARSPKQR